MPIRHCYCALLCLLTTLCQADQNDPKLDELFKQLRTAPDPVSALPLENAIWQLWLSHADAAAEALMTQGIVQMNNGDLRSAVATFTELTELTPDFAEAWNKRATVYYLLGDYAASDADIAATLALEPFHFGALSGRGLVYAAQQKFEQARRALHAALEVNPNMLAVKANLEALDSMLRNRSI
jgi:Flp pilus assembly protein TadD